MYLSAIVIEKLYGFYPVVAEQLFRREHAQHVTSSKLRSRLEIYPIVKRAIDTSGAAILGTLLAPALAGIALAVKLGSPGPIIYRQQRLTTGGRVFTMYKFRTMYHDAEEVSGAVWAASADSRTTPVGRFLRRTHLDELPQLINILRGEMSFIGPRPERPELSESLSRTIPSFHRRLQTLPGLSGLAQVKVGYARTLETYRRKVACDRLYIKRKSFALDLYIAALTIFYLIIGERV